MKHAKIVPPPNAQRTDPTWNWGGVKIVGNSMCQGNSNEDVLKALAIEFNITTLEKIDTYNYYAMYFSYLESVDPDIVERPEAMDWLNHAAFIDFMIRTNDLPVKVVCYSTIGDRLRKRDKFELKSITNKAENVEDILEKTERVISVGTLILPSGHWRRIHAYDSKAQVFEENDPFGTPPYKTPEQKVAVTVKTKYSDLEKQIVRRIISIEDV